MSHQWEHHIEVSRQFSSQISFLFVKKIQFGLENKTSVFLKHLSNTLMKSLFSLVYYNRVAV